MSISGRTSPKSYAKEGIKSILQTSSHKDVNKDKSPKNKAKNEHKGKKSNEEEDDFEDDDNENDAVEEGDDKDGIWEADFVTDDVPTAEEEGGEDGEDQVVFEQQNVQYTMVQSQPMPNYAMNDMQLQNQRMMEMQNAQMNAMQAQNFENMRMMQGGGGMGGPPGMGAVPPPPGMGMSNGMSSGMGGGGMVMHQTMVMYRR